MSIIVAIDPNFFVEASQSPSNPAIWVLNKLVARKYSIRIALDSDNCIYNSYQGIREMILEHEKLRVFWDAFLRDKLYLRISCDISDSSSNIDTLKKIGLQEPVMEYLFSITTQKRLGNVCVMTHWTSSPENLLELTSALPTVPIWTTDEGSFWRFWDWLSELKPTYFPDENHLEVTVKSLTEGYNIPAGEEPCYEFKQPAETCVDGKIVRKLSAGLLRDAMQAVCAMLNSHVLGYVFIGISNGSIGSSAPNIEGFDTFEKNNDEMTCDIRGQFEDFYPRECNQYIVPLVLTIPNGRAVAVLVVLPSDDNVFVYDNTIKCGYYMRVGTSSIDQETVYYHGRFNPGSACINYYKDRDAKKQERPKTIGVSEQLLSADLRGAQSQQAVIFALSEDEANVVWVDVDTRPNRIRRKREFITSKKTKLGN